MKIIKALGVFVASWVVLWLMGGVVTSSLSYRCEIAPSLYGLFIVAIVPVCVYLAYIVYRKS